GRSSYARVMIELRADMELKDNIVVAMPKITRESHYTCNVCVEYESKPPRCSSCTIFGHIHEECLKNTGFKPHKKYRPVLKKSTASSSDNKKKGAEPTIEFGTNEGTTNLVNNRATSSGSSFMNADNSSSGTTLIIEKIGKFEDLLTSGQAILVDKAGNPLKKIVFPGEYDSEGEVALVDNDMARSMAYERVGFGTQSLLEQWKDSYGNGDYDDDPYDDDMYDGQDLSHELHDICDNLDIRFLIGRLNRGIAPVAIIDRQLPFEYTIASRSTDVMVWNAVYNAHNEVACLMLGSMTPELHGQLKNSSPYEMLQELKSMFDKQARVERFDLIQTFYACKLEEGKSVSSYFWSSHGLTSEFVGFVRNYNKHNMGKTIGELHGLLIEYENGLPKKTATPQVMAIQGGRIQKDNKKLLNAKGKSKGKGKGKDKSYLPKPKNPKPYAIEYPAKDDAFHHYKEVGHCKRNCPAYLA
ncbi:hypothetical protein Tco_0871882, partial [Tanacetum coccineum]